jgi:hypothetical protein
LVSPPPTRLPSPNTPPINCWVIFWCWWPERESVEA